MNTPSRITISNFGKNKTGVFYNIGSISSHPYSRDRSFTNILAHLYITLDIQSEEYELSVYTIFDLTGHIGGIYEVVFLLLSFVFHQLSKRVHLISIMNTLNMSQDEVGILEDKSASDSRSADSVLDERRNLNENQSNSRDLGEDDENSEAENSLSQDNASNSIHSLDSQQK